MSKSGRLIVLLAFVLVIVAGGCDIASSPTSSSDQEQEQEITVVINPCEEEDVSTEGSDINVDNEIVPCDGESDDDEVEADEEGDT